MLMRKNNIIVLTISRLALFFLLCFGGGLSHAAEDRLLIGSALGNAEQLVAYQLQIEDLEFEFGPYHPSLIEPLESMIALLNEDEDYERVAQLQNRQLQVMRTELGFEHPDLVPLLQSIMTTQLALGNWKEISDQLEHIRHLRTTVEVRTRSSYSGPFRIKSTGCLVALQSKIVESKCATSLKFETCMKS